MLCIRTSRLISEIPEKEMTNYSSYTYEYTSYILRVFTTRTWLDAYRYITIISQRDQLMIRTYVGIGFAFFSLAHFKYFIIISKTVVGCTVRTSTHFTHSRSRGRAGWFTILILVTFRLYKKTKVTKADTRPVERDFSACGNNLLVPSRSRINTLRVVMV